MVDLFEPGKIQSSIDTLWDKYDKEDKVVLKNVLKKVEAKSYSLRQKSTKITMTLHEVVNGSLTYETLRLIELCSTNIFNIEANLKNKTLRISKWKHQCQRKPREGKKI